MPSWKDAPLDESQTAPAWQQAPVEEETSTRRSPAQMAMEFANQQVVEPIRSAAQGSAAMLSGVPAVLGGGAASIAGAVMPGPPGQAERWRDIVANRLQYQPTTEGGQRIANVLGFIPEKLSQLAEFGGQKVMETTGSPYAATVTDVALNAIPMMLGKVPAVSRGKSTVTLASPLEMERVSKAGALPVPVDLTKGQVTRDAVQLRLEENLAQTTLGRPIRERHMEQNQALLQNLDILAQRAAPKALSLEELGKRMAQEKPKGSIKAPEGALAQSERRSLENVNKLYEKARSSPESSSPVSPQSLIRWITENGAASASVPEIRSLAQMLKNFGAVTSTQAGTAKAGRKLTMNEMEEIRKLAVKLGNNSPAASHFMGEAKAVIDKSTEHAGGDLYKSARRARFEHAQKFEEPQAISSLLAEKSRTDRAVALEKVWGDTVLRGSISDLERIRNTLLKTPDRRLQDAGRKSWRDIASHTIEYIKSEATKSVALDERGNPNISPAALKKAVDRIGNRKLDLILGKSTADQLRNVVMVAQDTKTLPPYKGGSTTTPNVLAMMDKLLPKLAGLPAIGPLAGGGASMLRNLLKEGLAAREASSALKYAPGRTVQKGRLGLSLQDIGNYPAARLGLRISPALGIAQPSASQE